MSDDDVMFVRQGLAGAQISGDPELHRPLEAVRDFARAAWGDNLDTRLRELIGSDAVVGADETGVRRACSFASVR